jgi:anti-sigma-K factor RskA
VEVGVRDEHIKELLDRAPLAGLGEEELAAVRAHATVCGECARAFAAARVSASLLEARASEVFEPSPFFRTRVLAALRERQAAGEAWSFGRLWKAAGLLVSSMAATVAVLAALTFVAPQQTAAPVVASAADTYTAEDVIFDQASVTAGQVSDEQVLATLYGADEGAER